MSERGATLIELILAAAIGIVILGSLGSFYVFTTRLGVETNAQVFLQRQAQIIFSEMASQIEPATCASPCQPLQITTCSGVANSLQVTNAAGVYCFRRDSATGVQLLEDRTDGGGGTWNLLAHSLAWSGGESLSTVDGACPTGGFCPSVTNPDAQGFPKTAIVTIRLRYRTTQSSSHQTMTFTTSITRRN